MATLLFPRCGSAIKINRLSWWPTCPITSRERGLTVPTDPFPVAWTPILARCAHAHRVGIIHRVGVPPHSGRSATGSSPRPGPIGHPQTPQRATERLDGWGRAPRTGRTRARETAGSRGIPWANTPAGMCRYSSLVVRRRTGSFSLPSWMSRVRDPSPAPHLQDVAIPPFFVRW